MAEVMSIVGAAVGALLAARGVADYIVNKTKTKTDNRVVQFVYRWAKRLNQMLGGDGRDA